MFLHNWPKCKTKTKKLIYTCVFVSQSDYVFTYVYNERLIDYENPGQ